MSRLVLLRHGQSTWNLENRFTGWIDVSLSPQGLREAENAGELLADIRFDVAFTSALMRAQHTLFEVLKKNRHCHRYIRVHPEQPPWYQHFVRDHADEDRLKVYVSEALNERYYGDLQGQNKGQVEQRYGAEQVHLWRRSFDVPPPNGESLSMTAERTLPYFNAAIANELLRGGTVLVSAHGNSLRAIVMHLERMDAEQVVELEIATGVPHVFELDEQLNVVAKEVLQLPE